jgi:hypothetical protein
MKLSFARYSHALVTSVFVIAEFYCIFYIYFLVCLSISESLTVFVNFLAVLLC